MKIVGLIVEYNPFHNGHSYHIERARALTGADAVVAVMSGDFVQRGAPAVMPKHLRAKCALESGADLVLELPFCFAAGSAEYFAGGAVSLLNSLGCVDALCFGSECGDCGALEPIARILAEEPAGYRNALQSALREGLSFPRARQRALTVYLNSVSGNDPSKTTENDRVSPDADALSDIFTQPNNILGIEYLKALYQQKSAIKPYSIQRVGAGYHARELSGSYSSASAIRQAMRSADIFHGKSTPLESLAAQLPPSAREIMAETYGARFPVYADDFSLLLRYRLLRETRESLTSYQDVSADLTNRIWNLRGAFTTFEEFCHLLKTKELTYARISRGLLHILLDLKASDMAEYRAHGCGYARLLGFRQDSAGVLSRIKETSRVPLLTKLTQTEALSETAKKMLRQDIFAGDLYESVAADKFHTEFCSEYEKQIVKV